MFTELLAMNSGSGGGTPTYEANVDCYTTAKQYRCTNAFYCVGGSDTASLSQGYGVVYDGVLTVLYSHTDRVSVSYSNGVLTIKGNDSNNSKCLNIMYIE